MIVMNVVIRSSLSIVLFSNRCGHSLQNCANDYGISARSVFKTLTDEGVPILYYLMFQS